MPSILVTSNPQQQVTHTQKVVRLATREGKLYAGEVEDRHRYGEEGMKLNFGVVTVMFS